uniref:Cathelicidin antimicrobial peptide CATH6 n=1 Tax=Alligator sinensis TaxID=38654 RepID=A0A221SCN3_ALLSI|nr:cathelicidin antimicrobial peptide CATH6 precursor [Alligator sinensis]
MKSCWGLVLLVGCMASAATSQSQLNYNEAVSLAVDFYNRGLAVNNTFQLLRTAPSGDVVSSPFEFRRLNFTIMETTCPVGGQPTQGPCQFKENGLVRACVGFFSAQQVAPLIVVTCEEAPSEPVRVTRWLWLLRGGLKAAGWGIRAHLNRNQ